MLDERYFFSTLNEYIEGYRDGANGKPQANTAIVINYENVTIEHKEKRLILSQSLERCSILRISWKLS